MIKLIILGSLCAMALGQADRPSALDDKLPQLNRYARQLPQMPDMGQMSDMGQMMGSGMSQLGNSGQGQLDTIDPMGLIKKSQDIAKQIMTGRKRRDAPGPQQLPLSPPAPPSKPTLA